MIMNRRQRGVTLIELMTVVVVISILASIAVPTYRRYLIRAQRSDAMTSLLKVATNEEKFQLQNGAYTTSLTGTGTTGLGMGSATSDRGFYALTVATTTTGYTATATPVAGGAQASDTTCATFTVNESGVKRAQNSGGTDKTTECWK
jgi:type IV pilus assembly protein PilE